MAATMRARVLGRVIVLAAAGAVASCVAVDYGPQPFRCSAGNCPEGYACVQGRCCDGPSVDDPANPCRLCRADQVCVETVAGTGVPGFTEGPAGSVQLRGPNGIAVDGATVYFSEVNNHAIRMLRDGRVTTLAGGGNGFADGPIDTARFDRPTGLAVGPDGAIYVADAQNVRIRRIADGMVSTVAGSGQVGNLDGAALRAQFRQPQWLAVDDSGTIYVADTWAFRVRMIADGRVTTLAGGPSGYADGDVTSARFVEPTGIAVDGAGRVIVGDRHRLRTIQDGQVGTLAGDEAGFADGPLAAARFDEIIGVAAAPDGAIYVTDTNNHRIRKVANGQVTTVAGQPNGGSADGPGPLATFDRPSSLAAADAQHLHLADSFNNVVRTVTLAP